MLGPYLVDCDERGPRCIHEDKSKIREFGLCVSTQVPDSMEREHLKFNKNKSKTSRLALAKFMKAKFWKNRSPKDPAMILNFKDARKELLDLQEKEDEEKCKHFFAQMHKVRRSQRMKMTYEFLRTFKKQTVRKQPKRFTPISTWIYELHKFKGTDFRISQSDKKAIKSPSTDSIHNIIKQMKKGTVPGPHQMVIELYQHAPEVFVKQVTKTIGKAYENNSFPQKWVETIQIPIPKKARPQSVNDYRKISICNAGYRIYATYLLKLLDEEIETMGNYQAAFMRALEELVSEIRLDQDAEINLPVILSFADDIIIIELSRRDTIKARCKQAIRNAKGLIPFIKKTKMHWKIAKLMYKMVISPSMTYGLNVVTLAKSNRLRQYEREILKDMLQAARNQPKLKTQEILEGKTITKIIKVRRICYYGHLLKRDQPHILNSALIYTTTERKVGRPIYTWEDSLRQDLSYHNRNQEEWDTLAQNKMEMKKAADELYQLPETDTESSAPSEENEEEKTNGKNKLTPDFLYIQTLLQWEPRRTKQIKN
ncbi:hypothetical protein EVAR_96862_1 [Eumeta japonica]|uniref:Reverse transcriptase domain-containing protein n=1 Tax=Eumeta variegata TaxID=151549 RepID=A0A4C1WNU9_EUMVA|nr:hypothetical protein EVAR_96862_1 [Eumeta japonica]